MALTSSALHVLSHRADRPPAIDSAPAIGLAWLVRLRWSLVAAALLVGGAARYVDAPVDLATVFAVAIATAISNVVLVAWAASGKNLRRVLTVVLSLDAALLTIALRASGGAMNPFSVVYIVHVALAALLLDGWATVVVTGTTFAGFGALFLSTNPHAAHMHSHEGMVAHLYGMLVAYALTAVIVGYFVYRVARALERREREMGQLHDWASRNEKLASLSTLAAGAAHELGTPLGTIVIVAKELEIAARKVGPEIDRAALAHDAELVREEAERCRAIIQKLAASAGEGRAGAPSRQAVVAIVGELKRSLPAEQSNELRVAEIPTDAYATVPRDAMIQALLSLVANGFDACAANEGRVTVHVSVDDGSVTFHVDDDGAGLTDESLRRLGEPFFSTKGTHGMGLGIFLARTFAEQVGGSLAFERRESGGSRFLLQVPGGSTSDVP